MRRGFRRVSASRPVADGLIGHSTTATWPQLGALERHRTCRSENPQRERRDDYVRLLVLSDHARRAGLLGRLRRGGRCLTNEQVRERALCRASYERDRAAAWQAPEARPFLTGAGVSEPRKILRGVDTGGLPIRAPPGFSSKVYWHGAR